MVVRVVVRRVQVRAGTMGVAWQDQREIRGAALVRAAPEEPEVQVMPVVARAGTVAVPEAVVVGVPVAARVRAVAPVEEQVGVGVPEVEAVGLALEVPAAAAQEVEAELEVAARAVVARVAPVEEQVGVVTPVGDRPGAVMVVIPVAVPQAVVKVAEMLPEEVLVAIQAGKEETTHRSQPRLAMGAPNPTSLDNGRLLT